MNLTYIIISTEQSTFLNRTPFLAPTCVSSIINWKKKIYLILIQIACWIFDVCVSTPIQEREEDFILY